MKRLFASAAIGLSLIGGSVVLANEDKITKGFFSFDAMGCMLLRECKQDVVRIYSSGDLVGEFPESDWDVISSEFNEIMLAFEQIGVKVFLADEKYFPVGHRGVYHTVGNNFFLNRRYVHRPHVLMSVVRHEGWHAAQDCMAGTIDNSMIAIIKPEEDVPKYWAEIATDTYKNMPNAIPWEKEAFWAGHTEGMTQEALEACAGGEMWKVYEPTPLTRLWLVENGYITDN
tara:strand:- start:1280 stop:1966 length:687 start_codon:yes stop_codon:yes gene_type:complete